VTGSTCDASPPPNSVEQAYHHLNVAALDARDIPLPAGEVGEISVRAESTGPWGNVYSCMLGYWRKPDETAAALRRGWLHTGDIGSVVALGVITLVGRKKDLIIRGEANIYPAEIERVLLASADVAEAVIVGLPNDRLGEIVADFLQLKAGVNGSDELAAHLRTRCAAELALQNSGALVCRGRTAPQRNEQDRPGGTAGTSGSRVTRNSSAEGPTRAGSVTT
jgi:long-chain acyl-CoA synthetase